MPCATLAAPFLEIPHFGCCPIPPGGVGYRTITVTVTRMTQLLTLRNPGSGINQGTFSQRRFEQFTDSLNRYTQKVTRTFNDGTTPNYEFFFFPVAYHPLFPTEFLSGQTASDMTIPDAELLFDSTSIGDVYNSEPYYGENGGIVNDPFQPHPGAQRASQGADFPVNMLAYDLTRVRDDGFGNLFTERLLRKGRVWFRNNTQNPRLLHFYEFIEADPIPSAHVAILVPNDDAERTCTVIPRQPAANDFCGVACPAGHGVMVTAFPYEPPAP